ncbi:MAG: hypothetical protein K9N55_09840 [Phycisphaerae bacterium]|nr:hypothetical protein [Phycisphaerae bacterium]
MSRRISIFAVFCMIVISFGVLPVRAGVLTVTPSEAWNAEVEFPADPLFSRGTSRDSARWVKFTILLDPYDANVVHFQDSRRYVFHYDFAAQHLDPFVGMTSAQFNAVTLFEQDQEAILGAVILPPLVSAADVDILEYGIQFVRQDTFTREEIATLYDRVRRSVLADPNVQAFYFPTYEQQAVALANEDWFAAQGIPLGSTARWAEGNTCYSQGWALGTLKFVSAVNIEHAYHTGELTPRDILLTDAIPAELPYVAGIVSLVPSTPNSHVAILANTYRVPFVYLSLADDAQRAQDLIGQRVIMSVYDDSVHGCEIGFIDTQDLLTDMIVSEILELKKPVPLVISAIQTYGDVSIPTDLIRPEDVCYVGGKASNFGILRAAVPDYSPKSLALTFDVWNAFLDQPIMTSEPMVVAPGGFVLIYADSDVSQGPLHADFKLSRDGESLMLVAADGVTILDEVTFEAQQEDVSFGRVTDGSDEWQFQSDSTPGRANSDQSPTLGTGLVINELMADNKTTLEDPDESGNWPDWIELYNASDQPVTLNGLYLTDDVNDLTRWHVSPAVTGQTLREEIQHRLALYPSYPPADMQQLAVDLAVIRSLFRNPGVTTFGDRLRSMILEHLAAPDTGFDPNAMLRFRSSTNVEDSADFTGAGLYDSFSGCLQDDLDADDLCACDPNRASELSVFDAIRKTYSSFYNTNAFLERLRRDVNESDVGMGVLVHHAFPDDLELANGVATMTVDPDFGNLVIHLVTQAGAVSVTNPVDASMPEEVVVQVLPSGAVLPKLSHSSSLVPLGGTVMAWRDDYVALAELLRQVYDQFGLVTGKQGYALDLEYKLMSPGGEVVPDGGLVIKQVRQMPEPDQTVEQTPFLINTCTPLELYTGEPELIGNDLDILAYHRLKSRWTLETRNTRLDQEAFDQGIYTRLTMEFLDDDQVRTSDSDVTSWPSSSHLSGADYVKDGWAMPDLANPRWYQLTTREIPRTVSQAEFPIFTLENFGSEPLNVPFKCLRVDVEYDHSVMAWTGDPSKAIDVTSRNSVYLWVPPEPSDNDLFEERALVADGISISSSFYYPALPKGKENSTWFALGATAPLLRWDHTVIDGLTSEPIVLTGYFSQTYRPEHHNRVEHFLFEPRLEPGISQTILEELVQADIRWIHLTLDHTGGNASAIRTYGYGSPVTE